MIACSHAPDQSLPLPPTCAGEHQAGQAWKYQAGQAGQAGQYHAGVETLGRPSVEIPGGRGNTEKVRRGDTRQAWKHQAMEGVETLSRQDVEIPGKRENTKQA